MIIVKLQGGLGNQMFQYALGRNLSLIHSVPFKIDLSYLKKPNQSCRTFRLGGFKIDVKEATEKEIRTYRSTLQKVFDRFRPALKRKRILERSGSLEPWVQDRSDGYFVGHWNDENYFKSSEEAVRKDFELRKPFGETAQKIANLIAAEPESVSLHIRRGDYVSIPKIAAVHLTLPLSYYIEAIKKIIEQKPNASFFISSDDIGWAKENFPKSYPVTFVSASDIPDYEELVLMGYCKHNIIANSTFSWWGAWLNQNPQKIVIAPRQWFNNPNRGTGGLIPSSWLTL